MFVPLFINFRHSFRAKMIGNVAWHLRDKREMIAICSVALQSLAEVKGGCSAEVVQLFLYPLLFSRLWQKLRRRDNHTRWSIFRTIIHSSHSNYHHHPIHNASSRVSTSSEWQQWHLLDGEKTKMACFQCWQAEVDILSVWQHNRNHSVTLILYMFLNKLRFAKRNTNVVQGQVSLKSLESLWVGVGRWQWNRRSQRAGERSLELTYRTCQEEFLSKVMTEYWADSGSPETSAWDLSCSCNTPDSVHDNRVSFNARWIHQCTR